MKTLLLILFGFVFILLLISYPFKIKWRFHINLLKNIGYVVFKVFFIRLLCEKFKINEKGQFDTGKEKSNKTKNQGFFKNYVICLAKRVDVKHIDVFCDIGAEDDAYFISMLSGFIGAGLSCIFSIFLDKYSDVKIYSSFVPDYQKSRLEFTGKIIVAFNLMAVFISLFEAYKTTKKQEKEAIV